MRVLMEFNADQDQSKTKFSDCVYNDFNGYHHNLMPTDGRIQRIPPITADVVDIHIGAMRSPVRSGITVVLYKK